MLTTIALSAALASVTTEGLLENAGAPAAQRVELDIHPGRTAYTGRTVITLQLDDPTDSVSLHADGVFIASATLGGVKAEVISEPKGAVTLQAAKVLDPGTVDLVIEFSGKYREGVMRHSPRETAHDEAMKAKQKAREAAEKEARTQGRTLPKPSEAEVKAEAKADKARMKDWKKNPEMEAVAWTALWPGKARYVFPSFDEPRFRIPITLEITAPSEMMVVAGTPETGSAPGAKGATVHTFAPTAAVPAYMVGFAVGSFKTHDVADAPVPTKVYAPGYAPPARVEQAVGMLGAQAKELEGAIGSSGVAQRVGFVEMADGTGIHGVPGFVAFDEEASPWAEDRATHVLAHDWFGGAVGPSTWEDLWVMEMLSAWADLRVAAKGDAGPYETSRLARAIVKEGGGGSTAKAASGYEGLDPAAPGPRVKGAAVLAMFAAHYGPGKLLDGVKAVIGTNTTTDLPGLLAAIGKSTGTDAAAEMTPWLEKPGVPLVTFTRTDTGFTVARAPYVWSTEEAPEEPTAWMIPVAGRTAGGVVRAAIPAEGGKMDVGKGWFVPQAPAYVWTFADPADFDALIAAAGELRPAEAVAVAANLEALVHAGAIDAARVLRAIRALAPVAPAAAAPSLRAAQRMALVGLPDDQAEARATFTKWWLGQMTKDVSPTSRLYPYRRAAGDDAAMAAYLDWAEKAQADVKAVDRDLANEAMRALGSTKDLEYLTEVLQKHGDAEADAKHLWAGAIIGASQSAYLRKKTAAWFMERPDSAARMAIFQEVFADYPDEAVVFLAKAGKDLKRVKPKDRPSVLSVGLGACSGEPVEELAKAVETWNSDASKGVIADLRAGVTACEAWRKDEMATVVGLLKVD